MGVFNKKTIEQELSYTENQFGNLLNKGQKINAKSATEILDCDKETQEKCFEMIQNMFEKIGGEKALRVFINKKYPNLAKQHQIGMGGPGVRNSQD